MDNSKGKDSVYFYKPFLDKDGNFLSLFGIGVDKDGKVDFKTLYNDVEKNRFNEMLMLDDKKIVYIKK